MPSRILVASPRKEEVSSWIKQKPYVKSTLLRFDELNTEIYGLFCSINLQRVWLE